jgi:xanthine dehydrogenase accessory factor
MVDIYKEIQLILQKGEKGALASIVSRKGSAPMSADAKMLVLKDGSIKGTIGGGCMEADVWAKAKEVLQRGTASKMRFELSEKEASESGHICGGIVDVLVEPLSNFDTNLLSEVIRLRDEGEAGVLASVVSISDGSAPGRKDRLLIRRDGSTFGEIEGLGGEIAKAASNVLQTERPSNSIFDLPQTGVQIEVFLEPVMARPKVFIFGGGHISQYIARVASVTGFRLIIVEDRVQYANPERFPDVEEFIVVEDFENLGEAIPHIEPTDMAVIVTRGHQYDQQVLVWAWERPFRYLGMIGSRTKVLITYRHLEEKMGVPREEFMRRVRAPVGLEIGADTPGEIAVSIVAELIQVRRQSLIRDSQLAGSPKSAGLLKLAS